MVQRLDMLVAAELLLDTLVRHRETHAPLDFANTKSIISLTISGLVSNLVLENLYDGICINVACGVIGVPEANNFSEDDSYW